MRRATIKTRLPLRTNILEGDNGTGRGRGSGKRMPKGFAVRGREWDPMKGCLNQGME